MRRLKPVLIIYFLMFTIVPIVFLVAQKQKNENPNSDVPDIYKMQIPVYLHNEKTVENTDCFDYICGVVASEMSPEYHIEALKAQAVASFTYMINRLNYISENPDADIGHSGGCVCDDSAHCMAYADKQSLREKWGEEYFNKYYPNIENAVSAVLGEMLTYNSKPINAVFCSMSNGKTQSALEVWGKDVPYLQSVESESDIKLNGYACKTDIPTDEFRRKFSDEFGVTLPDDASKWIGETVKTESGMVKQITVADTVYSGVHIRSLFSLRSASFDVSVSDGYITFTTYGHGHGVGMIQCGAEYMAQNGSNYRKILMHYYTGVEISNYKI